MSHWVRFVRASGKYQFYGWPHGATVYHLGDDRWQDEAGLTWRDGRNRKVPPLPRSTPATQSVAISAAS